MSETKKHYRVDLTLDLETEDEGRTLAVVNVMHMSYEKAPLLIMTQFMRGLLKLAPEVIMVPRPTHGETNQRIGVDPDLDCEDFDRGEPEGCCDGMGHYHCDECKYRSKESIKQKHEDFMLGQYHQKEWPKIKAIVIDTGEEVMVDDHSIDFYGTTYYNMWHNTADGMTYHDDDLEFIDERLQKTT